MKSFPHIVSRLFNRPALITPARHAAICQLVEAKMQAPLRAQHDPDEPEKPADCDEPEMEKVSDVAIIPVHGVLVPHPEDLGMSECGCALEGLNAMIDEAEANQKIKTVIYDFRTPGGDVCGVAETGRKIRNSRKSTIGFTDSECCSGGLWLAAQCRRFYGTQSSSIGSVGVYCMSLDLTAALKRDGVKMNAIFAGKHKLLGAYFKPLTDEERAILQGQVDRIYSQFKMAMESYRIVSDDNFGNGLVFDGEQAVEIGFCDGVVDGMDEIIEGMVD